MCGPWKVLRSVYPTPGFPTNAQLQSRGWSIRLQWLPDHEGVYGDERADALAKDAVGSPGPGGHRGASPHY